jgi:hypothetical protein
LHGTGKHKVQASCAWLGSHFPAAGVVVSFSFTLGVSPNSYANTAMPGSPSQAFATQVSISGRKDGRIEGNATLVPADPNLSPVAQSGANADVGFNGHVFAFAGGAAGVASGLLAASAERRAIATATVGK